MLLFAKGRGTTVPVAAGRGALAVFAFILMAVTLVMAPATATAGGKFAAITVDARNGSILYAENADSLRHPASLTKMMTLYLLFQDMKAGKVKLDSTLRMSARAASMAPSKLGVKPGDTFTVETAIRALVVKSANDVAAAVAENLGGTEAAFARRMTSTARAIGMSRTTFVNASGLPNNRQITTARDMATLGLRLMRDFPQYYPYFRSQSFTYAGRTVRGHNRLIGKYDGADGIKTGYINASGFNLVTSARRGDQRLVGVVLGGRSGPSRDAYMRKMLDKYFPRGAKGQTIAALAGSSKGVINPVGDTEVAAAEKPKKPVAGRSKKKDDDGEAALPADDTAIAAVEEGDSGEDDSDAVAADGDTPNQKPATIPQVLESSLGGDKLPAKLPFQVKAPEAGQAKAAETVTEQQQAVASLAQAATSWTVQVGAYATKNDAQARLRQLQQMFPEVFDGRTALTATVEKDQTISYRARFTGFDESAANAACKALAKRKNDCYVLAPAS